MKQVLYIILLLALSVFASCSKSSLRSTLVEIDSLSNDSPHVALTRLAKMYTTMDTSHKADLMYYKLLKGSPAKACGCAILKLVSLRFS